MRKLFFLTMLTALVICASAQNVTFSKVKIYCKTSQLPQLFSLGIPTEGVMKKDAWLITELSATDIAKVKAAGFTVETQIEDMQFYYRDRNEHPEKYPSEPSRQSNCNSGQGITTPSHFVLGTMGSFYKYAEMLAQLDSMRVHFPNLITVKQQIGTLQTIEGRPTYYVKISDNPDVNETEPEVMYSALTHAREPMGMQALIFYMWYLLENYGSNAEITTLIDNTEMYFVPCVNSDGYYYNQTTDPNGGGMWRKNRRNIGSGDYGIDLNRNYGYEWGYDNVGSSPTPSDETYRGTAGFSEPETQIMKWFCENHQFKTSIDYHCYGNYLIIPWCYIASPQTPDSVMYNATSALMAATNGYMAGTVWQTLGYMANGGSVDWFYGEQSTKNKMISWSPEAGDGTDGFWPASNRIEDIAKVNIEQNLYVARFAGRYAEASDLNSRLISQQADYFVFNLERLGLDAATFTVSLIPVSSNILSTGSNKVFSGMAVCEIRTDSIAFALQPSVQQGDEVTFVLQVDNGMYTVNDTIHKVYGTPSIIFSDLCSNTTSWTAGGWATTTSSYHSSPSSITDSPGGNYSNNQNKSITLSSTIDLTNKVFAQLEFWTKYDLENNYDYVQVKISTDGGSSWTPLCGKYTNPGTADQILDSPLYDGTQSTWVKEEIDLGDFLGNNIKIRFTLVSDSYQTYDGFYFDDIQVLAITQPPIGLDDDNNVNMLAGIYPNPVINMLHLNIPGTGNAEYKVYDTFGRLLLSGYTENKEIRVDNLNNGMYMLEFIQNGKVWHAKFIKE
jgi:carboxypeptidase T